MRVQETTQLKEGWCKARVGDILKVRNGYAFKSSDYKEDGVPLIRQSDLGDDVVDIAEAKRVDVRFLIELPSFVVRDGDLLIGMSGSLGKIAKYQHAEPALQNQRTGLLLVKPDHDAKFAKLVLKFVEPQILSEGKGVAVQNVSAKEIEDCTFPLPPLPEQKRIVGEIEKQFTRLETGIRAMKRVQANLKRYRAAVLKAACEGRLVPTEAALAKIGNRQSKFENGAELLKRILIERRVKWAGRGKYKEPSAPDTTNLPKLPEGWAWATWNQIGVCQNGRPFKSSEYVTSGIKLLRPGNLHASGKVLWNNDNTRYLPSQRMVENPDLIVEDNELIMNLTAQSLKDEFLGRVCLTGKDEQCLLNQRLARLTPFIVPKRYVLILLKSWRFRRFVDDLNTGSLIQHMFTSQLAAFTFPLPPLAEQKRIVAEVDRRLSVVDELETLVSANLQRATRLRQSILQKAFEGNLFSA